MPFRHSHDWVVRTDAFLAFLVSASNNTCGNGANASTARTWFHNVNIATALETFHQYPTCYLYKQQQLSSMINIGVANKLKLFNYRLKCRPLIELSDVILLLLIVLYLIKKYISPRKDGNCKFTNKTTDLYSRC